MRAWWRGETGFPPSGCSPSGLPPSGRSWDFVGGLPMLAWLALNLALSVSLMIGSAPPDATLAIGCRLADLACSLVLIVVYFVRREPVRKARGPWPRIAALIGFASPLLLLCFRPAESSWSTVVLGSVLVLVGTVATTLVVCWLGRSFSIFPQARALVTNGPYRFVRHPMYLVEMLTVLGVALRFEQPWSSIVMAVVLGAQLVRAHYEERTLAAAFPAYRDYAQRTARFVPGLY